MSKKLSWLSIVAGVLSILAGFYLMANPALSLLSFAILFALIFMVNGISDIIKYFSADEKSGWDLFTGVMTVLFWHRSGKFSGKTEIRSQKCVKETFWQREDTR